MPRQAAEKSGTHWLERIARARDLTPGRPAAAEILTFYAALAEQQRKIFIGWQGVDDAAAGFDEAIDVDAVVAGIPDFLRWLEKAGTAHLAAAEVTLATFDSALWREILTGYLAERRAPDEVDEAAMFVVEATLQPIAEAVAMKRRALLPLGAGAVGSAASDCPVCGRAPVVGVLREDADGARRSLVCSLCFTEWPFLRSLCPGCDERRFDVLPVYTADELPHVRVEACDTCHRYVKCVDLTKNATAVPVVDDLASVTLDLWARTNGYTRLQPNILRIEETDGRYRKRR